MQAGGSANMSHDVSLALAEDLMKSLLKGMGAFHAHIITVFTIGHVNGEAKSIPA
jgi:hypothetical protein